MRCGRCQGLMVERPHWQRDGAMIRRGPLRAMVFSVCVNCGNYEDAIIRFHRRRTDEWMVLRHARIWRAIQAMAKEEAQ